MKPMLLTVALAVQAGHKSVNATGAALTNYSVRHRIVTDAKEFVANCLLCIHSRSGSKTAFLLSTTLHASKRYEVLYFDHLFSKKMQMITGTHFH